MENKMDEYQLLTDILETSLRIDQKACTTYYKFYKNTHNKELRNEWLKRSEEERTHIFFWKRAISLSEEKSLPLIFKNSVTVRNKIKKTCESLEELLSQFDSYNVYIEQMTLAFMLEAYMLHPTFMEMFQAYNFIDKKIEKQYEEHVSAFINMIERFHGGLGILHVKLFSENLQDLYNVTKEHLETALRDPLTGLYNRRGFIASTQPILNLADRENLYVGIVLLDFDNFKNINDRHGHAAGDAVLKAGATILNSCLRESDIAARYGGDEFIVSLVVEDPSIITNICKEIEKEIEKQASQRAGLYFSVSLGTATSKLSSPYEKNLAALINNADQKLYEAKNKMKSSWVI